MLHVHPHRTPSAHPRYLVINHCKHVNPTCTPPVPLHTHRNPVIINEQKHSARKQRITDQKYQRRPLSVKSQACRNNLRKSRIKKDPRQCKLYRVVILSRLRQLRSSYLVENMYMLHLTTYLINALSISRLLVRRDRA